MPITDPTRPRPKPKPKPKREQRPRFGVFTHPRRPIHPPANPLAGLRAPTPLLEVAELDRMLARFHAVEPIAAAEFECARVALDVAERRHMALRTRLVAIRQTVESLKRLREIEPEQPEPAPPAAATAADSGDANPTAEP